MSRLKLYWISQHGSCPGEESLPGSIRRVLRGHSHLSDESYPRVVLVVKNPPASAGDIRDGGSIPGLEDPLEEGMTTHSSILAWRISMDRGAWRVTVHGVANSRTRLSD